MNSGSTDSPGDGESSPHLDEDACLSLLHGLLPRATAEKMLAHMADCPACERLFLKRAGERERLRASRVLRSLPDGNVVLETREASPTRPGERQPSDDSPANQEPAKRLASVPSRTWNNLLAGLRRPIVQVPIGLIAAAAVLFLVLLPSRVEPPVVPVMTWLPPHSGDVQVRDAGSGSLSPELVAGLAAYDDCDLHRAIDFLQRAEVSGEFESIARDIYLGSALALDGRYAEASSILQRLMPAAVRDEWYTVTYQTLYIALQESGRTESADSLLRVIAREPEEYGEWARQLLQHLNREM